MQARQVDEVHVVHVTIQVLLGFLDEQVDLLQPFQVPHGRRKEQAEYHVYGVGESQSAFLLIAYKVYHHVRLEIAHGDTHLFVQDDTEGNGRIRRTRAYFFHVGDTQDDEYPTVVELIAGTLVGIGDVH